MPFQAGKCEGCGEYDYLTFEDVDGISAWLCKYCKAILEDKNPLEIQILKSAILQQKK